MRKDFDVILNAAWASKDQQLFWLSRSCWSLEAILRCRKISEISSTLTIWVPDFFCNSTLEPLRKIGCNIVFYHLNDDLSPSESDCLELIKNNSLDVFLLTHFFGECIESNFVVDFCKSHNAWFIEDAAHVMLPTGRIGKMGDFIIYSPHKLLPMPDGALLVVSGAGPSKILKNLKIIENLNFLLSTAEYQGVSHFFLANWTLKRIIQICGFFHSAASAEFNFNESSPVLSYKAMSKFSKQILIRLIPNLAKYQMVRVENLKKLDLIVPLLDVQLVDSHSNLKIKENIPYLASYSGGTNENTINAFNTLRKKKIPVSTWPDLPPEVLSSKNLHSKAVELRATRLYLPCHHSIRLERLISKANKKLNFPSGYTISEITEKEWFSYIENAKHYSFLQASEYGASKAQTTRVKIKRLVVRDYAGKALSLSLVTEYQIPFIGKVAHINQGPIPLNFDEALKIRSSENQLFENLMAIKSTISYLFQCNFLYVQISPFIISNELFKFGLRIIGLKNTPYPKAWTSAFIDLTKSNDELFSSLSTKWRGHLRKSIKLGVAVSKREPNEEVLKYLIDRYQSLQRDRGFIGLSESLIKALSINFNNCIDGSFNVYTAHKEGFTNLENSIGTLVTVHFGRSSVYLIGESDRIGRSMQSNSSLLWHAVQDAKNSGCEFFDLGGLDPKSAPGVVDFKKGLKGIDYSLIGEWYIFNKDLLKLIFRNV